MQVRKRQLTALCALLLLAASLDACGSGVERAASVSGVGIASHQVALLAGQGHPGRSSAARHNHAAETEALGMLIADAWISREASSLGLETTDAEVSHRLELLQFEHAEGVESLPAPHGAPVLRLLYGAGVGRSQRLWAMKLALAVQRVEAAWQKRSESEVPPVSIAAYYGAHQGEFRVPEDRDYHIVEAYKRAAIERAKHEIVAGVSFRDVAHQLTIDPVAPDGIRVHFRNGEGSPPLDAAIFGARAHLLVGPLKVATYYLFEVVKVRPAHELTLRQASPEIRRLLARERAAGPLREGFERHWSAQTSCPTGRLKDPCMRYRRPGNSLISQIFAG